MPATHRAAVLPEKGTPLTVVDRPTPTPGPRDVLIRVKAVALNPIDHYQRDMGLPPLPVYPAVIGFDVAGTVEQVGAEVPAELGLSAGTRVGAFASCFYEDGAADYGAFQEYVLVKAEGVAPLPDTVSFEQGATVPTAWLTALTAWTVIDIPLDTPCFAAADRQAVLVWGGSSSVGSMAVQTARLLGFAAVYATASPHNHAYVRDTLGATAVFDHHAPDVAAQIAAAAARDGVHLVTAHVAVAGGLQPTLDVLRATKGAAAARVVHSPLLPPDHPTLDNTVIRFTAPLLDAAARARVMRQSFHGLLKAGLASGAVVPSPPVTVAGGGLAGLNAAIDTLRAGVSCTKIVVPI